MKERLRRRVGQQGLVAGMRVVENRAIFDYDQVEEVEFREDAGQVAQRAAGVQDELAAGAAKTSERSKGV
jgi:hypothetical protein